MKLNGTLFNNFNIKLWLLTLIYLILHFPFLTNGYGVEEDSWGLVVNALEMNQSGSYVASRLPGHPIHEYLLSLFIPPQPLAYNLVSAVSACLAFYFSVLFFRNIKLPLPILSGLALAFCPIVFTAGTYTIDYALSLAMLMTAWYLLSENKVFFAALFLALAVGVRITNAAFLLPMLFFVGIKKENVKSLSILSAISFLLSMLFYLPVYNKYGLSFFDYTDQFPYPNIPKFIYKSTIGVFGLLGTLSLLILIPALSSYKKIPFYVWMVILISVVAYIRLPQKSAYLIPIIPFVIILAAKILNKKQYIFFCMMFIISGWMFGVNLVDKSRGSEKESAISAVIAGQEISLNPFVGNILADYHKREIKKQYVDKVLTKVDSIKSKSAIISGWWYNQVIIESSFKSLNPNVKYLFYCNQDSLSKWSTLGYSIYFLREQNLYNDLMFKMNCTDSIAKPFD